MKSLTIVILATIAVLSATTVATADPPAECAPTIEVTNGGEATCAPGEPEEMEEAEEAEEREYEEMAVEEERSNLTASSIATGPASKSANTPLPLTPPRTKLAGCRRASEATIRAEVKHIHKLRGQRRRSAERRLDRALCREAA